MDVVDGPYFLGFDGGRMLDGRWTPRTAGQRHRWATDHEGGGWWSDFVPIIGTLRRDDRPEKFRVSPVEQNKKHRRVGIDGDPPNEVRNRCGNISVGGQDADVTVPVERDKIVGVWGGVDGIMCPALWKQVVYEIIEQVVECVERVGTLGVSVIEFLVERFIERQETELSVLIDVADLEQAEFLYRHFPCVMVVGHRFYLATWRRLYACLEITVLSIVAKLWSTYCSTPIDGQATASISISTDANRETQRNANRPIRQQFDHYIILFRL